MLAVLDVQMGGPARTTNCTRVCRDLPRPAGYDGGTTIETMKKLCQQGLLNEAVEALGVLVQTHGPVSRSLVYGIVKRCVLEKDLVLGRRVHALTVRGGYGSDTFLCNHVVRMYASHARLQEAMELFRVMAEPDAFTWSAIISAHVEHGQDRQAIELYYQMRRSSVKPDGYVFVAALQACARGGDLETGQQVHAALLASGVERHLFVCNSLVDMYAKCGSLEAAEAVFNELCEKDVVTWNTMIAGYSQKGMGQDALRLFRDMLEGDVIAPTSVTFVCALQACASVGGPALEKGRQLHAQIREQGFQADVVVGSSLVNMYAKCGSLEDARKVFNKLGKKNVVTWNGMIAGYSQQSMGQEALHLYSAMREEGTVAPDSVTFVCLLQACASVGTPALEKGRQLHQQIREQEHEHDLFVSNSLVNMYAKCGSLVDAQGVFDKLDHKDVVTWTALIAGYSQQGMGLETLHLYSAMQEEGLAIPNAVTFVCLLQACTSVGAVALEKGKQLHAQIRERGQEDYVYVANNLVSMYVKCGSLEDALGVFGGLEVGQKDIVTWNAMIAGYSQQGMGQEALHLYSTMLGEGRVAPNSVTFVCLLQACANVAALDLGKQLHAQIEEQGLQVDALLAVSLINMYAKSGSTVDAQRVFQMLLEKDAVAWNALLAGYARQGESDLVFSLFHRMREDGIQPDNITFLNILAVCSHAGLVNKGREYFESMSTHYGITPTAEHYACMVDLLGRAGQVDEALTLVRALPVLPNASVWHTLLAACQKWSNVEVGRQAFDEAVKQNSKDTSAYVLMSNIYTGAQMREQAQEMQARRKGMGAWKQPGQSWWTDIDGVVHTFLVGDKKHPESDHIYAMLRQLSSSEMFTTGRSHTFLSSDGRKVCDLLTANISDGEVEGLCQQREKLTSAQGLNKQTRGEPHAYTIL